MQSKYVKDQAAAAKRASTTITNLVISAGDGKSLSLSQSDLQTLTKAASILNRVGNAKSVTARNLKNAEAQYKEAFTATLPQVQWALQDWSLSSSTINDKIAFIYLAGRQYSLTHYIAQGLPIWNRAATPEDWRSHLDEILRQAVEEFCELAAHQIVKEKLELSMFMQQKLERFNQIKQHETIKPTVKAFTIKSEANTVN